MLATVLLFFRTATTLIFLSTCGMSTIAAPCGWVTASNTRPSLAALAGVHGRQTQECFLMLSDTELEVFFRSHEMCRAVTGAACDFFQEICGGELYGNPLPFEPLERFRLAMQAAHKRYVVDPGKAPPPLRVVQ
jgi:hypothetical protein